MDSDHFKADGEKFAVDDYQFKVGGDLFKVSGAQFEVNNDYLQMGDDRSSPLGFNFLNLQTSLARFVSEKCPQKALWTYWDLK